MVSFLLLFFTLISAFIMLPFLTLYNIILCIESSLDEYNLQKVFKEIPMT